MVSVRKRSSSGGQNDSSTAPSASMPEPPSMLLRLRNLWQFACLCQWLYIFGAVVKLDVLDVDEMEAQFLSPHSSVLQDIGLALLKFLSSHRNLSHDLFDEYARRQFTAKAPDVANPFGDEEMPAKFSTFDVLKKVRTLHQMTQFIMMNPEKLREKMAELKDVEHDQTTWRIEPFGWDSDDNSYFVLDDNRIYRLTEPPPPPVKSKKNTKKSRAEARRASKRRRISTTTADSVADDEEGTLGPAADDGYEHEQDDGLGGMEWKCVAVSLEDVHSFLATIPGKKDPNEKNLRQNIIDHLVPILEQQDARRQKREKEREKELLNLAKLATAKRSNRIASRQEQLKQEQLAREEDEKRRREQEVQRKEEQKRRKLERERDNRLLSRERRLRERKLRRARFEEELAQLSGDGQCDGQDEGGIRLSERQRMAEIEKSKEALRELQAEEEEEEWAFDCVCGLHGKVDDGQHSVSCEKCNVWQHSKCLDIDEKEAEKDDFHFVCGLCRRRAQDLENGIAEPRTPVIKIKVNRSSGPVVSDSASMAAPAQDQLAASTTAPPIANAEALQTESGTDWPASLSRPSDSHGFALPRTALGPPTQEAKTAIPVKAGVPSLPHPISAAAPSSRIEAVPVLVAAAGDNHNPFLSRHPELSPPGQSPRKSHAYETIYEPNSSLLDTASPQKPSPKASVRSPLSATAPLLVPFASTASAISAPTPASVSSPSKPFADMKISLPPSLPRPAQAPPSSPPVTSTNNLPQRQRTPSAMMTPQVRLTQSSNHGSIRHGEPSSPLLPPQGGLSPIKQPHSGHGSSIPSSSPAQSIFPLTAALSPSLPEQNLTPPVKQGGLAHRQSIAGGRTDVLPSSSPDANRTG